MWGGPSTFKNEVLDQIEAKFQVGSSDAGQFKYLGLNVHQINNKICIDQISYISDIKEILITQERRGQKHDSLHSDEQRDLQVLVGQLNLISTQTRSDLSFYVCDLNTRAKSSVAKYIIYANNILTHAKR